VKAIKSTSLEDLIAISWLPAKVARSVFMHLHKDVAPIEETVEGDDA
jgi:hypothetical protein